MQFFCREGHQKPALMMLRASVLPPKWLPHNPSSVADAAFVGLRRKLTSKQIGNEGVHPARSWRASLDGGYIYLNARRGELFYEYGTRSGDVA
ncbi:hypothetical protein Taro_008357 [Colocasia esculenta]|uniref:Uncharacterized protein n=1 Tax=Colocasia esculenta TaxID=4460 RepID=A0A843TTI2_COLES|nr:hypothetical protein [Colocasia esculenta]